MLPRAQKSILCQNGQSRTPVPTKYKTRLRVASNHCVAGMPTKDALVCSQYSNPGSKRIVYNTTEDRIMERQTVREGLRNVNGGARVGEATACL